MSRSCSDPELEEVEAIIEAFVPWAEIAEEAGEGPSWLLSGYLAAGHVTLLAGKPKAGKSTLACALAEAVDDPETIWFLDRYIRNGPVVYVSEEGAGTLGPKLGHSSGSVALTRDAVWPKPSWPALITAAAAKAMDIGAILLVIDSLSFWASFREGQAKDSGAAQAAMDALTAATSAGLAVLLVHHQRKAGGDDGDAVRDSGAIVGAVDAVVELEKLGEGTPDTHRRLVAMARWTDTPPVLVVDWDRGDGDWRLVGRVAGRDQAAALGIRERILAAMPEGRSLTEAEVMELLDLDKRKAGGPLRKLVKQKLVSRSGSGKRGDPYRYEKVSRKVSAAGTETRAEKVSSPVGGHTFSTSSVSVGVSPGDRNAKPDREDSAEAAAQLLGVNDGAAG